jgi:hypothetical protein
MSTRAGRTREGSVRRRAQAYPGVVRLAPYVLRQS